MIRVSSDWIRFFVEVEGGLRPAKQRHWDHSVCGHFGSALLCVCVCVCVCVCMWCVWMDVCVCIEARIRRPTAFFPLDFTFIENTQWALTLKKFQSGHQRKKKLYGI